MTGGRAIGLLWLMSDHSAAPRPHAPVLGEGYDFQSIRTSLGGDAMPPNFVIHRAGAIVGICLGLKWNPLAESNPVEVWVGRKEPLPKWGEKLALTTGPLPVYVRREEGGQWIYVGRHEVSGSTTDFNDIKRRLNPPAITGISRIVFLKPLTGG